MAITLLALSATDSAFPLVPTQVDAWRKLLERSIVVKNVTVQPPTEATVELDGSPDGPDAIEAVVNAFRQLGVVTGTFALAISEHPPEDEERETPPYFEETIDLAQLEEQRSWVTAQIEIYAKSPLGDADKAALERELRAACPEPVQFCVPLMHDASGMRLELQPMPAANAPGRDALLARATGAAGRANLAIERLEIGAYVRDWDNTVFKERIRP